MNLKREIGRDEVALVVALGLVALGCWDFWRPGAALVPGLVMLWLFLPARRPFVEKPLITPKPSRRTE